ncbi:hypothetical protein [Latilactobacillus sakei]|uniref:hypothetical protein n=1 Tax=Latilactobacillus sakei TaxID=1599 RepID=UPI00202FBE25|nr:hypothetical protein [Latilactobacillus sakei]MCM1636545.1 hypothetical protein [Latilactobacillus sakei]
MKSKRKKKIERQVPLIPTIIFAILIVTIMFGSFVFISRNLRSNNNLVAKENNQLRNELSSTKRQNSVYKKKLNTDTAKTRVNKMIEKANKANNGVFKSLYEWEAKDYATRYKRANKFANAPVLNYLAGGNIKDTKALNEQQKIQESVDGHSELVKEVTAVSKINQDEVSGVDLVTFKLTNSGTSITKNQWYNFTFNLKQNRITELKPVYDIVE